LFSNFGGAVELGEPKWDALRRELKEEVNFDIGEVRAMPNSFNETIHEYLNDQFYHAYSTTWAFEVTDWSGIKNMEPHKTRDFGWVPLDWLIKNEDETTSLFSGSLKILETHLN
jgi:8-oxo-dGTP pyrophosphatase MutT (NUDIX family)